MCKWMCGLIGMVLMWRQEGGEGGAGEEVSDDGLMGGGG